MIRSALGFAFATLLMVLPALAQAQQEGIAIAHAKAILIPGDDAIENETILVARGKIQAAGPNIAIPAGYRIIDAQGKLLTPGFMNSDSQLSLVETGTEDTSDPAVISGLFAESFDVEYAINPNSTLLPVARADGLTRAAILPTASAQAPFDGLGAILRLSEGPYILDTSKAALVAEVGGMTVPKSGGSRAAQWMLIRSALEAARDNKPQVTSSNHATLLTAVNIAALAPVIEGKIPLVLIAYRESDIRQAIALVDEYKIHVVLVGAEEAWRVAPLLALHHIPVVLDPYASTPAIYDQLGARLNNAALLDRADVVISFKAAFVHVSYNAGIAIREGAGVAVSYGLPYNHAIKALTINPAQTWGIASHYGSLEPGKDADLVLWDGDPLEPRSAPTLVMVRGKQVSLQTRQTELEKRYSPAHAKDPLPPAYH